MAWKFDHPLGTLKCGALIGQLDVSQPHRGLHELRLESAALAGRICSVERECDAQYGSSATMWPANLVDAYVRGNDLVATYQATDAWPFAPQIYWRADTLPSIDKLFASVALLVSVSTHLLDTHPRICAVTQLTADEILHVVPSDDGDLKSSPLTGRKETILHPGAAACCLLWRLPGGLPSYAEIVPASDFRELTVRHEPDGTCQARWELIAEFMEKGVIRRTRLQSAFLPRERDIALAADCCRYVAERPLPLTT
jgi:hypothetical protein